MKFAETEQYYYYQEHKGEKSHNDKPKRAPKKAKQNREIQENEKDQWVPKQTPPASSSKGGQKGPPNTQESSGDNYRFNEGGTRDPKTAKGSSQDDLQSRSVELKDRDGNYRFRKSQPKQYKQKEERNINKRNHGDYEWVAKKEPVPEPAEGETKQSGDKPGETTEAGPDQDKTDKLDKPKGNFKDRNYGFLERRNHGKDKEGKAKGPAAKGQTYYVLKPKNEGESVAEPKSEVKPAEESKPAENKD